jgi:tetratricopeptide (TPR) repeat protein
MSTPPMHRAWWSLAVSAGLVACSSAPPRDTTPDVPEVAPRVGSAPSVAAFERAQQERAIRLQQDGHLAEAVATWEVLALLRPEVGEYRERLEQTQARIDADMAEHWRKAEQARAKGQLDRAQSQYLLVLQLRPDHAGAADALRAIEKERNRRSYLGRLSRVTLGKRGGSGTETAPVMKPAASAPVKSAAGAGGAGGPGATDALKPAKRTQPP